MALAEKTLGSVPLNNDNAANSANEPAETKSAGKKVFSIALVLGVVLGIGLTYSIMQLTVVRSLENSVVFEQAQKTAYITANELDFETIAPRLKALETSNSAKAEKEIILVNTINNLQDKLKSASKKVLEVEASAEKQIKAAKLAAIEALQE